MKSPSVFYLLLLFLCSSCQNSALIDETSIKPTLRNLLHQQQQQWNAGRIEAFMETYHHSDSIRYASGGEVFLGWFTALERFKANYPDQAAMGILTFSDIDITVLSPDAALVFGRFHLQRPPDHPSGLFTLIFRKTPSGWRITHDHTSAAIGENPTL